MTVLVVPSREDLLFFKPPEPRFDASFLLETLRDRQPPEIGRVLKRKQDGGNQVTKCVEVHANRWVKDFETGATRFRYLGVRLLSQEISRLLKAYTLNAFLPQ